MKKEDIVIIKDSFDAKHIVKITNTFTKNELSFYGGIVLESLDKSNLNTINFTEEAIELKIGSDYSLEKVEEDYPELWV